MIKIRFVAIEHQILFSFSENLSGLAASFAVRTSSSIQKATTANLPSTKIPDCFHGVFND